MVVLRLARLIGALLVALVLLAPAALAADRLGADQPGRFLWMAMCRVLLAGLRVSVRGQAPSGPSSLLVANHVSWLDPLVIGAGVPACFLAKSEVSGWPLIGRLARAAGTVFVDRNRRRSIVPANRSLAERLAAGRSVVLFAEGTTSAAGVLPFRSSHLACLQRRMAGPGAEPSALVRGVAIRFSDPVAAWVGDETLIAHLGRLLVGPPLRAEVRPGPERAVGPGFDRKSLGRLLHADVAAMLAIPPRWEPARRAGYFMMGGAPAGTGSVGNST